MALDIYFRENIERGLTATAGAILATAIADGMANREFVRGALVHCKAQAALYGLSWSTILADLQASATMADGDVGELLEQTTQLEDRNG